MPFGEYQYSLDDKGRVVIPAPFREFIEDGLVLTRGMEGCLYVFPLANWRKIEEQLVGLSLTDAESRAFVRFFYSGAYKTRLDNQGRVLIPPTLRQFAGLENDVIIAGAPNRLEIWSEARWWEAIQNVMQNPPAPEALRSLTG
ncbi:division/cell wall cluster transcriptional repressor MraZ [Marinithermus hydrothermalis]|uniref:Transcriptional regulator MraZ n=1 Tax=Marinithermus hydrothermalis (strain DSM 14884 / JCM 11576 / T1) TaxID=869210 RepID=F2NMK5_MARHT|nr:division/cell wall cluster transcriptional repressor MraZ [Marinithermus hydrothermalis]AEB12175.1 Protein mraZ [Marinithermus hydrothermalis DSM 14884]